MEKILDGEQNTWKVPSSKLAEEARGELSPGQRQPRRGLAVGTRAQGGPGPVGDQGPRPEPGEEQAQAGLPRVEGALSSLPRPRVRVLTRPSFNLGTAVASAGARVWHRCRACSHAPGSRQAALGGRRAGGGLGKVSSGRRTWICRHLPALVSAGSSPITSQSRWILPSATGSKPRARGQ